MAKGYWLPHYISRCPCCRSGPKDTYICVECDHVCRSPHDSLAPLCPRCRQVMTSLGDKWRAGRKGKRTLPPARTRVLTPGEEMLRRLQDKERRMKT